MAKSVGFERHEAHRAVYRLQDRQMTMTAGARGVGGAGIGHALAAGMTDREREHDNDNPPIDESSYGGSSAETGGLYDDSGPTRGNVEGDTVSEAEERGGRPPEAPSGG